MKICIREVRGCSIGKTDISMAFRNVPLKKKEWAILVLKAEHPVTRKTYFFCDKCLPFGSSISCAHFQRISDAIAYLVYVRTMKTNVNYLGDFLFAALMKAVCDGQLRTFLWICDQINFPVSLEKTFWGSTCLTFLGLLLDTVHQAVCILQEKVDCALDLIAHFLNRNKKKVTIHQIQKLCSFLNFLCCCVIPGHVFTRRLYAYTSRGLLHHHVRITREMRMDLMVWKKFLEFPGIFCRPFMDFQPLSVVDIDMFSDASRNFSKGFGAYCGKEWTFGVWDHAFMTEHEPRIEYLELFGVTVAVLNWIRNFPNKKIFLFCDNESVVHMINHCKFEMQELYGSNQNHNFGKSAEKH